MECYRIDTQQTFSWKKRRELCRPFPQRLA
jgi:hypothetical protein